MKILTNYVVNTQSAVVLPWFNKNGYLYSCVIEGRLHFLVEMSPSKLISQSLLHFAKDLRGAIIGSKAILGNINMLPISVCSQLDILWFPSKSILKEDCVWIAYSHIVDYKPKSDGENQTYVYLSNGHVITVDMNIIRFEKRYNRAGKLRQILAERMKFSEISSSSTLETQTGYQISKKPGNHNYEIIEGACHHSNNLVSR